MSIQLNRPARNLDEIYLTLRPEPLQTAADFRNFYSTQMDDARGGNRIAPMVRGLRQSFGHSKYKTFFIGHPGVGKSTEIYRLSREVNDRFRVVRFEAPTDLNAVKFDPFDVPLVMMIKLTEEIAEMAKEGTLQGSLPDSLLHDIRGWFDVAKYTVTKTAGAGASAAAGAKPSPISATLAGLLGFFVELRGEIKYNSERKSELVEYRINSLGALVELLNRLLDQANALLKASTNQEWLFIGEDFDKPGFPSDRIEALFVNNAQIFKDLRTHLIFNIPVGLAYSGHQRSLACDYVSIYDAPVYHQNHEPHETGRAALKSVLDERIVPDLFAEGQQTRLIVASGGNLTDLFHMTLTSSNNAALRSNSDGVIGESDVTRAINERRRDYRNRLGSGPYDGDAIPYEDKAKQLVALYNNEPGSNVPNPILLSLLRASVVQEFNGTGWFGVHPLIVDVLVEHQKIVPDADGRILGGTI